MKKIEKNKNFLICVFLIFVMILTLVRCEVLETEPQGKLSVNLLKNKDGVYKMLIGAYGMLDEQQGSAGSNYYRGPENWIYGSVVSDDAYKGSSPGDQSQILTFERYESLPSHSGFGSKWRAVYAGVDRCNEVLLLIREAKDMTESEKILAEAEARFLRGHYHFEAKKMWKNIPYIDENVEDPKRRVSNTSDCWPEIEADFYFAAENLPLMQTDVGRATKGAAQAYLAKAHLFQNEFDEAKLLLEAVIGSGQYQLTNDYYDMFNAETDNNSGAVFQFQAAVNTGSWAHSGESTILNYPTGGPTGSGFFQPTQNLVNSFKTDENGLPLFDSFNENDLKNDQGIASNQMYEPDTITPVDPRLDWTVGRRGIPYLDWGLHPGMAWIRDQGTAGPYSPIKNVHQKAHLGVYTNTGSGPARANSINFNIIRYAHVLLWAAEVEVEIGSPDKAREYVNMIRKRARDGHYVTTGPGVSNGQGDTIANYKIGLYENSWSGQSREWMRERVRFEHRLEFAMEGHRFFDLVRWGIAESTLNEYISVESTKRSYLNGAVFKSYNDYYPIPLEEIERSYLNNEPTLQQNPGY